MRNNEVWETVNISLNNRVRASPGNRAGFVMRSWVSASESMIDARAITPTTRCSLASLANESVPKIILNKTMDLLFSTAISILVISNHNSFLVLFDKIAYLKNIFIF